MERGRKRAGSYVSGPQVIPLNNSGGGVSSRAASFMRVSILATPRPRSSWLISVRCDRGADAQPILRPARSPANASEVVTEDADDVDHGSSSR